MTTVRSAGLLYVAPPVPRVASGPAPGAAWAIPGTRPTPAATRAADITSRRLRTDPPIFSSTVTPRSSWNTSTSPGPVARSLGPRCSHGKTLAAGSAGAWLGGRGPGGRKYDGHVLSGGGSRDGCTIVGAFHEPAPSPSGGQRRPAEHARPADRAGAAGRGAPAGPGGTGRGPATRDAAHHAALPARTAYGGPLLARPARPGHRRRLVRRVPAAGGRARPLHRRRPGARRRRGRLHGAGQDLPARRGRRGRRSRRGPEPGQ